MNREQEKQDAINQVNGWQKINNIIELPVLHTNLPAMEMKFLAYNEPDNFLFRFPKTAEMIVNMYKAGEVSHIKQIDNIKPNGSNQYKKPEV